MNKTNQMNQVNPSRQSHSAVLLGPGLVISDLLVVEFQITHNVFSGTY
ncbi:MAG: hypothetical protein EWM73_02754 [Nitrospira sp.]|nr:MAG: hypothetical protein EWM73_02754 [Nitrospira sp.]